jgi:hypothetical protein
MMTALEFIQDKFVYVDFHDNTKENYIFNVIQLYGDYRASALPQKQVKKPEYVSYNEVRKYVLTQIWGYKESVNLSKSHECDLANIIEAVNHFLQEYGN